MKSPFVHRMLLALMVSLVISSPGRAANPKEGEVTKLDGKKVFGMIEVTDDYTVRVSSDSGLQNIPLAMLSEKDFRKLGFSKDRNNDGRFWSERKDALEGAQKDSAENKADPKNDKSSSFEISLKEIAPFQPLIDVYEKSLADKKPADSENKEENGGKDTSLTVGGNSPMKQLFTHPGMGNSPFSKSIVPAVTEPISAAGSLVAPAVPAPSLP